MARTLKCTGRNRLHLPQQAAEAIAPPPLRINSLDGDLLGRQHEVQVPPAATVLALPLPLPLPARTQSQVSCAESIRSNASSSSGHYSSPYDTSRPFVCKEPDCGRSFKQKIGLNYHMRAHRGEKPYKCQVPGCGKSFTHKGSLDYHMRSFHGNERPYKCDVPGCGKAFTHKGSLKYHARTHTGDEKPHKCPHGNCERRFSSKGGLKYHVKRVHSASRAQPAVKPPEPQFPGQTGGLQHAAAARVAAAAAAAAAAALGPNSSASPSHCGPSQFVSQVHCSISTAATSGSTSTSGITTNPILSNGQPSYDSPFAASHIIHSQEAQRSLSGGLPSYRSEIPTQITPLNSIIAKVEACVEPVLYQTGPATSSTASNSSGTSFVSSSSSRPPISTSTPSSITDTLHQQSSEPVNSGSASQHHQYTSHSVLEQHDIMQLELPDFGTSLTRPSSLDSNLTSVGGQFPDSGLLHGSSSQQLDASLLQNQPQHNLGDAHRGLQEQQQPSQNDQRLQQHTQHHHTFIGLLADCDRSDDFNGQHGMQSAAFTSTTEHMYATDSSLASQGTLPSHQSTSLQQHPQSQQQSQQQQQQQQPSASVLDDHSSHGLTDSGLQYLQLGFDPMQFGFSSPGLSGLAGPSSFGGQNLTTNAGLMMLPNLQSSSAASASTSGPIAGGSGDLAPAPGRFSLNDMVPHDRLVSGPSGINYGQPSDADLVRSAGFFDLDEYGCLDTGVGGLSPHSRQFHDSDVDDSVSDSSVTDHFGGTERRSLLL